MMDLTHLPRAIEQDGLSEQIFERLRDAILDGALSPGQRLSAQELAAHFGVSTTPIRDALKRLEGDALVEIVPRRGTFVTQFSEEAVCETFQIREIVECAAADCMGEVTAEFMQGLEGIVDRMDALRDGGVYRDYPEYIKLDAQFHCSIMSLLMNKRLMETYQGLRWPAQVVRGLSRADYQRAGEGLAEHRAIAQAFAARDTVAAKRALLDHLRYARQDMLRHLARS